jgi:hypothetical protein
MNSILISRSQVAKIFLAMTGAHLRANLSEAIDEIIQARQRLAKLRPMPVSRLSEFDL